MIKEALSNPKNIGTACDFAIQAKDRREDLLRACRQAAKAGVPKATEGDLASSVGSDAALFLLEALIEDGREDADVIKSGFDFFRLCWNEWEKRGFCEVDASSSKRQDVVSKMLRLLDLKWLDHDYLGDVVQNSGILTSKELKTVWKARMNHLLVIKAQISSGGQEPGRGEKQMQDEEDAGRGKTKGMESTMMGVSRCRCKLHRDTIKSRMLRASDPRIMMGVDRAMRRALWELEEPYLGIFRAALPRVVSKHQSRTSILCQMQLACSTAAQTSVARCQGSARAGLP